MGLLFVVLIVLAAIGLAVLLMYMFEVWGAVDEPEANAGAVEPAAPEASAMAAERDSGAGRRPAHTAVDSDGSTAVGDAPHRAPAGGNGE